VAFAAVPGALVWTVRVELVLPPGTVEGEKLQVAFAGNWEHVRVTGKLKPVPGTIVTV
jgi:hypothetical protein